MPLAKNLFQLLSKINELCLRKKKLLKLLLRQFFTLLLRLLLSWVIHRCSDYER
uniref:Uncharacterized protein n=1 Tax=Siphoviridae sp. ct3z32 TaxID=2825327 RepID=A0A8S5VI07_9CAUD|nr:MAG TPA: hypothetical protein [Siphoviridae sp. ct3z32]